MKNKRRYREKRPIRLGAMQLEKTRHTEPSYFRVLLAAGLIQSKTQIENAWGKWTQVCMDPVVVKLAMQIEKRNNVPLPSVAAPFQNLAHVLAVMSDKQLSELRSRVS